MIDVKAIVSSKANPKRILKKIFPPYARATREAESRCNFVGRGPAVAARVMGLQSPYILSCGLDLGGPGGHGPPEKILAF